jgi:hypothetical protein
LGKGKKKRTAKAPTVVLDENVWGLRCEEEPVTPPASRAAFANRERVVRAEEMVHEKVSRGDSRANSIVCERGSARSDVESVKQQLRWSSLP